MNNGSDRNARDIKIKDQNKKITNPAEIDPDHHYQSGERTFTEPDNPPERQSRTKNLGKQQTDGSGKPTA